MHKDVSHFLIDWPLRDKVNRLEISRESAMQRRGVRWAKPKEGTDKQVVRKMRNEEIVKMASSSLIDSPAHPESLKSNNTRVNKKV